jgi:hypothetical protein
VIALGSATKIGYTTSLRKRAKQVLSAYKPLEEDVTRSGARPKRRLVAYTKTPNKHEAQRLEKWMHGLFAAEWIERELFQISARDAYSRICICDPTLKVKDCDALLQEATGSVEVRQEDIYKPHVMR